MRRQNGFIAMMAAGLLAFGGSFAMAAPIVIDSAGGTAPGFSYTGTVVWEGGPNAHFNRNSGYYPQYGTPFIATVTFSSLTPGAYKVYANWLGGVSATANYSINGGTVINLDQTVWPVADLTITDNQPWDINFQEIGRVTVGAGGTLSVVVTAPYADRYSRVDAIAINRIPEPASLALLGLAGLLAWRRRR